MKKIKRLRLAVSRSNKAIQAQIIDDETGRTVVAATSLKLKKDKLTKTEQAREVGKTIGELSQKAKIKAVVFDRRKFKFHGRVKALADQARKGGLDF